MKAQLEWKDGDAWKQAKIEGAISRNNNMWIRHNGLVYVYANLKEGVKVVAKVGDKWVQAGRVTRGIIFLGEGRSYSETIEQKFKRPVFA
jgi:hypothetical protein